MSTPLPTFIEAEAAIKARKDTALHRFIHEFEPSTSRTSARSATCSPNWSMSSAPPGLVDKEMADLLRSACCIAERKGEGTSWERFIASVKKLG
jgi:hypothetical protein